MMVRSAVKLVSKDTVESRSRRKRRIHFERQRRARFEAEALADARRAGWAQSG